MNTGSVHKSRHIILCGLDGLGFRTLEELLRLGEHVIAIEGANPTQFASRAESLGVEIVRGDYREESTLSAAGIREARSLVLTHDDDVANLHAALAAQEANPGLRIVLRMFNIELGKRVEQLFHDCSVLSSSAIAAPAFVAAALHKQAEQQMNVNEQTLSVLQYTGGDAAILLPLARERSDRTTEIFPDDPQGALCLALSENAPGTGSHNSTRKVVSGNLAGRFAAIWSFLLGADRRFRYLLGILVGLALLSTLIFYLFDNLSLEDALYFTFTIMTTTGFGDISLRPAPLALKLYGVLLMMLGAASLTLFYALITDAIVSARLARALGAAHVRLHDHVVVCGLGTIGYRVVEQIAALGIPVAAVELHETARFLPAVRRHGVPVLIGDARVPETLRALNVERARCLIVATDDDVANLETALNARAVKPDLRVVLRLFEPDLAARVERTFNIPISRSVSALAAPAFAAAAIGKQVVGTIPAKHTVLVVARAKVERGSAAEGETVSGLESSVEGRLLFFDRGGAIRRPQPTEVLAEGQEMLVVSTRPGFSQILERLETPAHLARL